MFDYNNYKVFFRHNRQVKENGKKPRDMTVCVVGKDAEQKALGYGVAVFEPNENFCKNTGRKRSMLLALQDARFEPDERKGFWDAYFEARGGKW